MSVLLLRLAGPLQSWGTSSRFVRRNTDRVPSKSGIIGLLAAAQGRRRIDPIEDLLHLRIGVRVDQSGHLERDFQTARTRDGASAMPLSYRFYLADAVFLVAVQGNTELIRGLHEAIRRPRYPLALGRRSCPPAGPLDQGVHSGEIEDILAHHPWLAAPFHQRNHRAEHVELDTVVDCDPGTPGVNTVRDNPLSFDPRKRDYGWRCVLAGSVQIPNPAYQGPVHASLTTAHDPFSAFGDLP